MPTKNPRLSVTLTPALSAVLDRLSELTKTSKSAIVAELLESSAPVLERMTEALAAAVAIRDDAMSATTEISDALDRAQSRLETQLGLAMDDITTAVRPVLDEAEKITRRASRGPSTPVPVTRGSGPSKTQKIGQSRGERRG